MAAADSDSDRATPFDLTGSFVTARSSAFCGADCSLLRSPHHFTP
jgi:hypothetical protein